MGTRRLENKSIRNESMIVFMKAWFGPAELCLSIAFGSVILGFLIGLR